MNLKPITHSFLVLFLTISSLLAFPLDLFAETVTTPDDFSIEAKAALAVDMQTGIILYEQQSEERMPVASITKLLSLYLVQQTIANGELSWDDNVTISSDIATLSQNLALSNVILEAGETYTVEELFETAVILSANAATVALAELVAGSEFAFVDLMKEQLTTWGITDFVLVNSTGLNNEDMTTPLYPSSNPTDENEFTAKDIAIITRHLLQDFPETLNYTNKASAVFESKSGGPATMYSTNWLLAGMPYEKSGVDGLKTGTTDLAGPSFVGTIEKDGRRVITVLLNAETSDARFSETSRLMDYAYNQWAYQTILNAGDEIPSVSPVEVLEGKEEAVSVIVNEDLTALLPIASEPFDFRYTLLFDDSSTKLKAPITKKQALGEVQVQLPADSLVYLEESDCEAALISNTTTFYANNAVERANFFVRLWRQLFD